MPAVGEAGPDLGFGDAARPPVSGLAIAEAEHEVPPAGADGRSEAAQERGPVGVVQDVKETAVEDGVELLTEAAEIEGVPDQEPRRETPLPGLRLCGRDGRLGQIDAGGL